MADTLFPTRHGSLGFARTVGRLVLLNWAKGTFLLINWAKTAPDSNRIRETFSQLSKTGPIVACIATCATARDRRKPRSSLMRAAVTNRTD